ncbi:hypothetical protein EJP82_13170 [Paenibacillus anaericanus]|uniref:Teneurin-like YD-shell domain-containing protein n=1 Tax=Paenibacillus anaericanus TaxID=170367 RepID=A0A3S1EHZ5_9BACL|nr:RHS repeat-associated core domain-containing protein [Paenibacillus anaericanus]RUT46076.1 hypothetical protein EJP82_13170 [Paenibacillus anaericanus]
MSNDAQFVMNPVNQEEQTDLPDTLNDNPVETPKPTLESSLLNMQTAESVEELGSLKLEVERNRIELERQLNVEQDQIEQNQAKLTREDLIQLFSVTEDWIQNELDKGFTLQELFTTLWTQSNSATLRSMSPTLDRKVPINLSDSTESVITSYVENKELMPFSIFETITNPEPLEFPSTFNENPIIFDKEGIDGEQPNIDPTEIHDVTGAVYAQKTTNPTPEILKPIAKISEAPYKVNLHGEDVSLLSGSLSIFTLPGRNGLSFSLSRTYDSSDAQYYEPDVGYSMEYGYVFDFNKELKFRDEYYNLERVYSETLVKYACSDTSTPLYSAGMGSNAKRNGGTFSSMYTLDVAKNNPPSLSREVVHPCGYEKDRIYYKEYRFAYNTTTTNKSNWYIQDGYSDTAGPFSLYQEAVAFQREINNGSYNATGSAGSYSEGYFDYEELYYSSGDIREVLTDYNAYNKVKDNPLDKRFPLGKGWRWNIPYLKFDSGRTYVGLSEGSVYEINGKQLKNYPWSDLSFESDTSVTYANRKSAYVLKSVYGTSQYFDSDGNILQIKDAYGNYIGFSYGNVSPYGVILTSIQDALGNSIDIQYTSGEVKLTLGDQTVIYKKTTQNNKELLTQVIDSMGRKTTYSYAVKQAKFNLLGSSPSADNPYALLTNIVHPTGAKTDYQYEVNPVTRYVGNEQVNQAFRLAERKDVINYTDMTTKDFNLSKFIYSGDIGSSFTGNLTLTTTVFDGLLETQNTFKKKYVNSNYGSDYFAVKTISNDGTTEYITEQTYDEANHRNVPITSSSYYRNRTTLATSVPVTSAWTYDAYQNVTSYTSPLKLTSSYAYDSGTHLLTTALEPVSLSKNVFKQIASRNAQGDILQERVLDSNVSGKVLQDSYYTYDAYGNITLIRTKEIDNSNVDIQIKYGNEYSSGFPTEISRPYKDASGQAYTQTVNATYNMATGALKTYMDGDGGTTSYSYDILGRLIQTVNQDGTKATLSINDTLNKVVLTDEVMNSTYSQWDPLGLTIESGIVENGVNKAKSKYGYDQYSRLVWSEDAKSNRTVTNYDKWGRTVSTILPDQSKMQIIYDDIFKTSVITDAVGNNIRQNFDLIGQVIKKEQNLNGSYQTIWTGTYDAGGHLLSEQDGKNNVTTYSYDVLGNLLSLVTPDQYTYKYSYNNRGLLTQILYPDQSVLSKNYDELGQLIKVIDPLQKSDIYKYDANGNMIRNTDRNGQEFNYIYSNRNFLLSKQGPTEQILYSYNDDGTRKTMTDNGSQTTLYEYTPFTGQLMSISYPDGKTISYDYDQIGNRVKMTTPFANEVSYDYNSTNNLTSVTWNGVVQSSYNYNANGQLLNLRQANGTSSENTYMDGNLSSLYHKYNNTTLNKYNYSHDINKNIVEVKENSLETKLFSYDNMDRITKSNQFNELYTYDSRGNRNTLQTEQVSSAISEDVSYSYDEWNRLRKVIQSDGTSVEYKYNGDNLLVERKEGNITTRYYYDGQVIIAEGTVQRDGSTNVKANYLYGNALVMREDANGQKGYYLTNGHGDVVEMRDSSGNILNQYTYDIWGNAITATETVDNLFRYSGEYWDDSVELQYLRARWYDPSVGRFINEDTYEGSFTNPLSLNLYTYVENNPLIYTDPSGHMADSGGASGGDPLYNLSYTPATDKIILARSANAEVRAKLLKNLIKEYKYGFFGDNSGGMTRNQFEYLYKLALTTGYENYGVAKWALSELDDYFSYGANDKTIAIAATLGGMSSGSISGSNGKNFGKVDFKNFSAKEIERKFALKKGQFHGVKQDIIKDLTNKNSPYKDSMKKVGNNPDIHLSSDGTIRIMSRDGKTSFDTNWNINTFLP